MPTVARPATADSWRPSFPAVRVCLRLVSAENAKITLAVGRVVLLRGLWRAFAEALGIDEGRCDVLHVGPLVHRMASEPRKGFVPAQIVAKHEDLLRLLDAPEAGQLAFECPVA